jgi:hypothetical protein
VSDLSYSDAERAALDRLIRGYGGDPDAPAELVAVLGDAIGHVRRSPIREEDEPIEGTDETVHLVTMWGGHDEARIILGLLATRGYRLVRTDGE